VTHLLQGISSKGGPISYSHQQWSVGDTAVNDMSVALSVTCHHEDVGSLGWQHHVGMFKVVAIN